MEAKCERCAFFVSHENYEVPGDPYDGSCQRYPNVLTVEFDYWCGEFRPYGAFAWQPERPEPETEDNA